ncbi:MAG: heat-inducible transcriptional repressor HrcA [Anaerolineae bacterium]|nr:heat-inducible transcriptional repressor HrcA [Anaerolineae bacterium]
MSTQEEHLPQLSKRQEEVLSLLVRSYTAAPEPVSSKHLVEQYELNFSSATVRNEMAHLEEMGYIAAPHTSAGRIPTALGYRYIVREMMLNSALSSVDQHYIENKFSQLPIVLDQWMKQAATVLARTALTASLVTPPVAQKRRFKHVELISIQGRLALMVLVLQGGAVYQRMLTLAEPVTQGELSASADNINALCYDLSANQIHMKSRQFTELEREVCEIAAELIDKSGSNQLRVIYRDGLSEIINSFPDSAGAQQAVRVFEERAFIDMILTEILHPFLQENVQVIIAGDGREEMSHLSLVLSHYGVPGQLRGMLGVLGPMNLNYGRAISAVRKVSALMTDMLVDLYDEEPSESTSNDER